MTIQDHICTPAELAKRLLDLPRPLVMTNGVFDILHRGHVCYLDSAAKLGRSLLVAINSDSSVRMLNKGLDRPLTLQKIVPVYWQLCLQLIW